MQSEPEDLYTAADVKRVRDKLVKLQNSIDPILQEKFSEVAVLDHDHTTQKCRAALNRNTNAFEGLVFNAYKRCLKWMTNKPLPDVLRNLADYLEQDYSHHPHHTGWIKRINIDFNKLPEPAKKKVLLELGINPTGNNAAERKKLFQSALLTRAYGYNKLKAVIQQYEPSK